MTAIEEKKIPTATDLRESVERAGCRACLQKRLHTAEEWANHPMAGHGYTKQTGYSHPVLARHV